MSNWDRYSQSDLYRESRKPNWFTAEHLSAEEKMQLLEDALGLNEEFLKSDQEKLQFIRQQMATRKDEIKFLKELKKELKAELDSETEGSPFD